MSARLRTPGGGGGCVFGCPGGADSITHYVHHCAFLWSRVEAAAGSPPSASAAGRLCLQASPQYKPVSLMPAFTVYQTVQATSVRISRASMEAVPRAAVRVISLRFAPEAREGGGRSVGCSDLCVFHRFANIETSTGDEIPWTRVAQDRDHWSAMEATFVGQVLRRSPKPQVPRRRWIMEGDDNATGIH